MKFNIVIKFFPSSNEDINEFIIHHDKNKFISDIISYKTQIYKLWEANYIAKDCCENELAKCNYFFASLFGTNSLSGKLKQFKGKIPAFNIPGDNDFSKIYNTNRIIYNTLYSLSMWKMNKNFSGVCFNEDNYSILTEEEQNVLHMLSRKYNNL